MSSAQTIASQRLDRALLRATLQRKRQQQQQPSVPVVRPVARSAPGRAARRSDATAEPVEDEVDLVQCSVCLTEMRPDDDSLMTLGCGHTFHSPCLEPWLLRQKSCPLCRCPTSDASSANDHEQVAIHG